MEICALSCDGMEAPNAHDEAAGEDLADEATERKRECQFAILLWREIPGQDPDQGQ
jgi:hypothetical protein